MLYDEHIHYLWLQIKWTLVDVILLTEHDDVEVTDEALQITLRVRYLNDMHEIDEIEQIEQTHMYIIEA